jgi:8-oxo-dGTP pyrophosphatase MutT (NUDIX family)
MRWDLPGGHLKEGETWEEGARREAKEETNLDIRKMKMISDKGKNKYFRTEDWGGELFSSKELPEHDDFLWVDPNTLADLNIGKVYLAVIRSAFK